MGQIIIDARRSQAKQRAHEAELAERERKRTLVKVGKMDKGSKTYKALQVRAAARGIDLDDVIDDGLIDIAQAPLEPGMVASKLRAIETIRNLHGFDTGEYPHIAPTKVDMRVSHEVPTEINGISIDRLAQIAAAEAEVTKAIE